MSLESSKDVRIQIGFTWGGPLDRIIPESLLKAAHQTVSLPQVPELNRKLNPKLNNNNNDHYWMFEAFKESLSGIGITNPNPAVGCVIVDAQGEEIARGATEAFRSRHAEAVAFSRVQDPARLKDATVYVTLEPCCHTGNQPPCSELLANSPVKRIVVSRRDPDLRVNGGGLDHLQALGKEVSVGILAREVTAWNFAFFLEKSRPLSRPVIGLKWAQTLDGQLADDLNSSQWITGPIARAYTHWLRQRYDAVCVGAGTVMKDYPSLTARDCVRPHQSDPLLVVLDPKGRCLNPNLEEKTHLEKTTFVPERPFVVFTTEESYRQNPRNWLKNRKNGLLKVLKGFQTEAICEQLGDSSVVDLLGHSLQSMMVEGGPQTLSLFMKSNCADVLHTMIAPILTAGKLNRVELAEPLSKAKRYDLVASANLGSDILLEMTPSEISTQVF